MEIPVFILRYYEDTTRVILQGCPKTIDSTQSDTTIVVFYQVKRLQLAISNKRLGNTTGKLGFEISGKRSDILIRKVEFSDQQ